MRRLDKGVECQTEDFIFDLEDNREPLEFTEWVEGDIRPELLKIPFATEYCHFFCFFRIDQNTTKFNKYKCRDMREKNQLLKYTGDWTCENYLGVLMGCKFNELTVKHSHQRSFNSI